MLIVSSCVTWPPLLGLWMSKVTFRAMFTVSDKIGFIASLSLVTMIKLMGDKKLFWQFCLVNSVVTLSKYIKTVNYWQAHAFYSKYSNFLKILLSNIHKVITGKKILSETLHHYTHITRTFLLKIFLVSSRIFMNLLNLWLFFFQFKF